VYSSIVDLIAGYYDFNRGKLSRHVIVPYWGKKSINEHEVLSDFNKQIPHFDSIPSRSLFSTPGTETFICEYSREFPPVSAVSLLSKIIGSLVIVLYVVQRVVECANSSVQWFGSDFSHHECLRIDEAM
jgi:hypothetical protein